MSTNNRTSRERNGVPTDTDEIIDFIAKRTLSEVNAGSSYLSTNKEGYYEKECENRKS